MVPDRRAVAEIFLAEAEATMTAMESGLLALEAHPEDAALLHTLLGAAHNLEGNASALNLDQVAVLVHTMKDILARLRSRTLPTNAELLTLLLRAVEAVRQTLPAAVQGHGELAPAHVDVLGRLRGWGSAPVPPPAQRPRSLGRRLSDLTGIDHDRGTLRVPLETLDRLLKLSAELAPALSRLADVAGADERAGRALQDVGQVQADLAGAVRDLRMVLVGPSLRSHARMLCDRAGALGKQARLVVEGEEVCVDVRVLEGIHEPLGELVRGAVEHGIEIPSRRAEAGKDPWDSVTLAARREEDRVVFTVTDDGAGVEGEPAAAGLDAVQRRVEGLGGTLEIETRPGQGTAVLVRVPAQP